MKTRFSTQKGSALVTVMIFAAGMLMILAAILSFSLTERRLNNRNAYWLKARIAAEAVAEYGFSQVLNQFSAQAAPPTFKPGGGNELVIPPTTFLGNGVNSAAWSTSNPTGVELIGGPANTVSSSGLVFMDPLDPQNQYDPLKGLWVFRRDVKVIAQASVIPPKGNGGPVTAYVQETITVRGAPLFAHAIFYAKDDLEIFPGPQMDIYGPVHTNGNLYVSNQSNATGLIFHDTVTTAGSVYHAWKNAATASWGTGNETLGQNPVKFVSASGSSTVNMNRTGAATGWMDSTTGLSNGVAGYSSLHALETTSVTTTFRQQAAALWGGNMQTSAMGVSAYNPISFNEVIGTDTSGNNVYADPHTLIEPPNPPATTDPYYDAKTEIEKQKYSTQAALYIKVTLTDGAAGAAPTATVAFYGPSASGTGTGPNGYVLLNKPTDTTSPLINVKPYTANKVAVGTKLTSGTNNGKYPITTTPYSSSGAGTGVVTYSSSLPTGANGASISAGSSDLNVSSGMYDQRRGMGIDLVEIDMTQLKTAVQNMVNNTNNSDSITKSDGSLYSTWNGAVYVEVNDTSTRANTGNQSASVRLINGQVASGSSLLPTYGDGGNGLTIATNAPVYVKGNFNADGNVSNTGCSTTADDILAGTASVSTSAQSSVCIAADAVTLLSGGFVDSTSGDTLKPSLNASYPTIEVAAAFLTGNVPTTAGANSGGAHNLPRLLENWNGNTVAIRGSMVCMFNSKIATQSFSGSYYGAPNRNWGFDTRFKGGYFPPLTPKVYSFRRTSFSLLKSSADYTAAKNALWP